MAHRLPVIRDENLEPKNPTIIPKKAQQNPKSKNSLSVWMSWLTGKDIVNNMIASLLYDLFKYALLAGIVVLVIKSGWQIFIKFLGLN